MSLPETQNMLRVYTFYGPYDGTNAADVIDWWIANGYPEASLDSMDGDVMMIKYWSYFPPQPINPGAMFYYGPSGPEMVEGTDYTAKFVALPSP